MIRFLRPLFAKTVLTTVLIVALCMYMTGANTFIVNPITHRPDFVGASSGGSGTVSSSTAHFVAVYTAATTVGGVTPSTAGKVFTSNGTGSDPSFQSVSLGGLGYPTSAPPAAASWTAVNSVAGMSLADGANGGVSFTAPLNATTNLRMFCVSLVAAPYTYTAAAVGFIAGGGNGRLFPIALRESATGKIQTFGLNQNINGIGVDDWSDPNTFAAAHNVQVLTGSLWGGNRYMQISNDSTNIIFRMGFDGLVFHQVYTELIAAFFTTAPDQACFGLDSEGAVSGVTDIGFNLFYWLQQ